MTFIICLTVFISVERLFIGASSESIFVHSLFTSVLEYFGEGERTVEGAGIGK